MSADTAAERLRKVGPNQLHEAAPVSPLRLFLAQFNSVIIWILIVA
ncbi:hypothetical protein LP420_38490 [Massilia sp. B-10]|nr:hypothetical protein LP420_38490 [Massilia sp. B-10]